MNSFCDDNKNSVKGFFTEFGSLKFKFYTSVYSKSQLVLQQEKPLQIT